MLTTSTRIRIQEILTRIANGNIVANGPPRQIVSTPEAKKLYFGEDFTI